MGNTFKRRYSAIDEYTIEELKRTYDRLGQKGRCRLLRKLQAAQKLPAEIAFLAVRDSENAVREWFARFGDFSPLPSRKSKEEANCGWPELLDKVHQDLRRIVLDDPDPFVRACLRENPSAFYGIGIELWLKYLRSATHLERLALVRNEKVCPQLIMRIANLDDEELAISTNERTDLLLAFLTNEAALHKLKDQAMLCEDHSPGVDVYSDGWSSSEARSVLNALWQHTLKWPIESTLHGAVYANVAAEDDVKAQVYQRSSHTGVKLRILDGCRSQDRQTLQRAMRDTDDDCREYAYTKLAVPDSEFVKQLIDRNDKVALRGLAANASVPTEELLKIREWFDKHHPEDDLVWHEIARNLANRPEQSQEES
jgi:hypothetical protein